MNELWGSQVGMERSSGRNPSRRVLEAYGPEHLPIARQIHLTRSRVNDIARERRAITADTALRLARFFGTTPQSWMNMQASYDLRKAENELGPKIGKIEPAQRRVA